jgi:hypothetical protein
VPPQKGEGAEDQAGEQRAYAERQQPCVRHGSELGGGRFWVRSVEIGRPSRGGRRTG